MEKWRESDNTQLDARDCKCATALGWNLPLTTRPAVSPRLKAEKMMTGYLHTVRASTCALLLLLLLHTSTAHPAACC